ncbi:TetR/AcrR family transcriptional repressor of multidrug resistance operon [Oceanisphaera litoralis]|uniref:TetR/AcrR family transcriptional regulator n=1 Tax=Oceanisphaera litoralis TaxID=225144 RepID=UPI00195BE8BF|nr:TetR/AcrR family transcriptional regulator [Oceanisphaera litoralis]MBM7456184.1 TetR/AcrR family transcriptional repressor of multidrug resistance operon [Oceanisphaera litoralis]
MTDKRERILAAAETLIAHCGFQGMSMQLVAKHANVATGTIYRYFADKETLLRCLHEERMLEVSTAILQDVDTTEPGHAQFRQLWLNTLHYLQASPDSLCYRIQYEASPLFDREEERQMNERYFQPLFEFFERGRETGLFRDIPAELLAFLALENLMLLSQKCTKGGIELDEALYQQLLDASWNAILKR